MEKTALCIIYDRIYNRGSCNIICEIPFKLDRDKKFDNIIFYFVGSHELTARQYEIHIQSIIRNMKLVTFKKHIVNLSNNDVSMVRRDFEVTSELEHLIKKYHVNAIFAIACNDDNRHFPPYVEIRAIEKVCKNHKDLIKDGRLYSHSDIKKRDWIGIYYDT